MILNKDELRTAIMKNSEGEAVRLEIEAHLQKATGPEAEGLLIVTPGKLLFAHRPPFSDPEVVVFDRSVLEIKSKQEDLWGAALKAQAGDESFDLKRVAPPDFRQLCEELEGRSAQPPEPPPAEQPEPPAVTIEEDSAPLVDIETLTFESPPEKPPVPMPEEPAAKCYIHPRAPLKALCDGCGKPICKKCVKPFQYKIYCPKCYGKVKTRTETTKPQKREKKTPWPPRKPPPIPQPHQTTMGHPPQAAATGIVEARSPALAFLFSYMPGFGQFYNKEYGKGIVVLLTHPLIIPWLWGFIDAVGQAKKHNQALGVKSQPAGCFAFLLTMFPMVIIGFMAFAFSLGDENSVRVVNNNQLESKQLKVQALLKEFDNIQKEYFNENRSFLDYIPEEVSSENDTGYQFQIIMLGENNTDFRVYAWAPVGIFHELDLWSMSSGGFIANEYTPSK